MLINLKQETGLPIQIDDTSYELILTQELNKPSYTVRKLHDLDSVWAHPVDAAKNKVIYKYSSGIWLYADESIWKQARVIYGIVVFSPGMVGGEYIKSSGQYHPICDGNTMATPEVYTVLKGVGHFLLQKAIPPYETIDDAILLEAHEGQTFIVPPDYGHLQINPGNGPLVISYVVKDGMDGVYEPFRKRKGAIYYEIADGGGQFVFNTNYPERIPLRFIDAGRVCQLPFLNEI